jgi:predicted ArsR family transcriptional regulator
LRNCLFHQLARQYSELVCSLNLQLIQGILEANGDQPERAVLAPRECGCCVIVRAPERPSQKRVSRAAKTPPRPTRDTAE